MKHDTLLSSCHEETVYLSEAHIWRIERAQGGYAAVAAASWHKPADVLTANYEAGG